MRLPAGQFLGHTQQRQHIADLQIVSSTHAAGSIIATHEHEQAYFCLTLAGSYAERYGRRQRRCGEGMVIFHPSGERHSQLHESNVQTLNVQIGDHWLRRVFDAVGPLDRASELRDASLVAAAVRMRQLAFAPDADSALAVEGLAWEILCAAASGRPIRGERRPRWLDAALERLGAELHEPLDFGQLAADAGVHPVHFAASFRRSFGMSAGEYRRRLRLELVRRRLQDPTASLSALAAEAGFSDQSHMTRAFKRYVGFTPAAYRRSFMAFKTHATRRE